MFSPSRLLITGCYRSGTTLLEKIVNSHPQALIASQPFPVLYFLLKQRFLDEAGIRQRYPLDHLFLEDRYTLSDFYSFLDHAFIDGAQLDQLFFALSKYEKGLWTPEILGLRQELNPGRFLDLYAKLISSLLNIFPKPTSSLIGSKEVLCEEFVPYLVRNGYYSLIIIRDPRDMIASVNFRALDNLTGDNRPILYSLRLWRKSVAFALEMQSEPNFSWIRYEDLVTRTDLSVAGLCDTLKISPFPCDLRSRTLVDQRGTTWRGNSSFHELSGLSPESIGRFRTVLPAHVIHFIEAVCAPEMSIFGYLLSRPPRSFNLDIQAFREPFSIVHKKFPPDYSSDSTRLSAERERLRLLRVDLLRDNLSQQRRWFLFPAAYRALVSSPNHISSDQGYVYPISKNAESSP